MGILQRMFGIEKRTNNKSDVVILRDNNYISFSLYNSILNLPEIRTAINTVAEVFSTIPMYHSRMNSNGNIEYLNSDINYVLTYSPNEAQTKTQFWVNNITRLFVDNNLILQPLYDNITGQLVGLYPLPYKKPKIKIPYIEFEDDPDRIQYRQSELIILTRFSEFGKGSNQKSTTLYETIIQAIQQRAVKNATNDKRIVAAVERKQSSTMLGTRLKAGDSIAGIKEIASQLGDGKDNIIDGFAYLDGQQITPLQIPEIKVERELLAQIINAVYNYFGVSEKIVNGTATEIEWEQFLIKTIKPIVNMVSEEFTRKLFTKKEIQFGNKIEVDLENLQIQTLGAKVALFSNAMLNGYLNQDEIREMIGQAPIPNGLGKKYRGNLNTANLEVIDEYQLSKANVNGGIKNDEK